MTCRNEILDVVSYLLHSIGADQFTLMDVVNEMNRRGTIYKETTIRTHVTSSMCFNAPKNHLIKYDDFVRIGRGIYKLRDRE